jgi:hypothetical protein
VTATGLADFLLTMKTTSRPVGSNRLGLLGLLLALLQLPDRRKLTPEDTRAADDRAGDCRSGRQLRGEQPPRSSRFGADATRLIKHPCWAANPDMMLADHAAGN